MITNIEIKQADKVTCSREWSWNSDDNGWTGMHFWYVTGGVGHIVVEDEQYDIYGGDCFCFDLSKNHVCTHWPGRPLSVYTVYFQADLGEDSILRRIVRNDRGLGGAIEKCVEANVREDDCLAKMWLLPVIAAFTGELPEQAPGNEKIRSIGVYLENHLEQNINLSEIAQMAGYSENQAVRLFKKEFGRTPVQYFTKLKMEQAKKMICYSSMSIMEVAFSVGYEDLSYFSKVFKQHVGCGPREYRGKIKVIL